MRNIDFKDTDKKLKECIYGIEFEVNKRELDKIDTKEINEESNLDEILEKILGNGACKKLNDKRKENGYDEMDIGVELAILFAIIGDYIESTMNPISNTVDNIENKFNRINNFGNREQRRYRDYNNRRNNYRRY